MNLLFDLGHPAHFHLFKQCIQILQENGHRVIITAKDQPVLLNLLQDAGLDFINLGRKGRSMPEKAYRQLTFNRKIWKIAKKHNIDLGIGISVSIPQTTLFCKMKSLLLDDDDRAVTPLFYQFAHRFAGHVLSPDCLAFQAGGMKYHYYPGYHELAYLHPARFTPDHAVPEITGIKNAESYFILRFNAFAAYHDTSHHGLSHYQKQRLVEKLSQHGRVLITSEKDLPPEFEPYRVRIRPSEMHSFMAFATMYIGDSQTMASEAAVLGTPSLRLNSFADKISYLEEQEKKYGLTFGFGPEAFDKMLAKIDELLAMPDLKAEWQKRRQKMLSDKIDVTALLVWFIENYPDSAHIMKENPDYQWRFR